MNDQKHRSTLDNKIYCPNVFVIDGHFIHLLSTNNTKSMLIKFSAELYLQKSHKSFQNRAILYEFCTIQILCVCNIYVIYKYTRYLNVTDTQNTKHLQSICFN